MSAAPASDREVEILQTMGIRTEEKEVELRLQVAGAPVFTPEELSLVCGPGEACAGEVLVRAPEGVRLLGYAFTDSPRMAVSPLEFSANAVRLLVRADTAGLREEGRLEGRVTISTNLGEHGFMVRVYMEKPALRSASGRRIRNLSDFVRLARDSYDEAFRFFSGKEFPALLSGEEARISALYEALTVPPVTYHRMEEFLIACGLKKPVVVTIDSDEAAFFNLRDSKKESLTLRKSEWGSVKLEAEVTGGFLEIPRNRVLSEDFVGSACEFEYIIHRERLSAGKNFGSIILRSFYSTVAFHVTASRDGALEMDRKSVDRRGRLQLMRDYMDRRLGLTDDRTFRNESMTRLASLKDLGENQMRYRLYEVFVEDMTGNREDARRLVEKITAEDIRDESTEVKAAYTYLAEKTGLFDPGEVDVVNRIRTWQKEEQESLLLLMIWLRTDPDLGRMPSRKLQALEEAYRRGMRSPLIYIDAAELFRNDERLLVRLTPFVRQVLNFAARSRWMTRELARRTAFLAGRSNEISGQIIRLLETIYGQFAEDEVLESVCKLLIKGSPRQASCFRWYERAVDRDIRITRLYEYFVETMPDNYQKLLPSPVLRYFLFVDTLSDRRKAMLYANIIRNREQDRSTYESYRPQMEAFALKSVEKGRENRDYAVIFQEFIKTLPENRAKETFVRTLFGERIYADDPRIREVVVRHSAFQKEEVVLMNRGEAYIHRYTRDACILLADGKSHRYFTAVEFSEEPLMEREELLREVDGSRCQVPGLWLYLIAPEGEILPVTRETASVCLCIIKSDVFTPGFRRETEKRFFEYLAESPADDRFDGYLESYDGSIPGLEDRLPLDAAAVVSLLIRRGFCENAYRILCRTGFEHVDPELLLQAADERIKALRGEPDPDTLSLSETVFRRGVSDITLLSFLARYFNGTLDELLWLREAASAAGADTVELDGRILRRAVLTSRRLPTLGKILGNYAVSGGDRNTLETYLSFEARLCFGGSVPISNEAAILIEKGIDDGRNQELLRKLSLLYYYTKLPRLTLHQDNIADSILEECALRKIRFSFFKELPPGLIMQYHLEDRAFVEYRASAGDLVILHYRMESQGTLGEEQEEPLREMYAGIFSKEFILFYGEKLTWYLTVRHGSEEKRTKTRTITMENVDMEGRSRYQLINRMLKVAEEKKNRELQERIQDFRQTERMIDRLFIPVCEEAGF